MKTLLGLIDFFYHEVLLQLPPLRWRGQGDHVTEDRVAGGDVVEELGVQMHQRERLQLRGEESGEAVGTVGLEGVIVVGVEGGHNGGSTASSITQFTSELRAGWE
jgi:hypothetical protein